MIQVFIEGGYYIQAQISDFDTKSPSSIKDCKPFDIWFAKKKGKSIKTRLTSRINKIFYNVKRGIQKQLSDFQKFLNEIKGRVQHYVPNFKTLVCKLIDSGKLSKTEKSHILIFQLIKVTFVTFFCFTTGTL